MPMELAELYYVIDARLDKFEAKLGDASAKAKRGGREAGESFGKAFGTAINQGANAALYGITLPVAALAKATFDATVNFERMKAGLTGLMGSAQKATAEIEKLRTVALRPGIDFESAVKGSQALQAVGVNADYARKMLVGLAKANALSGGTPDNLYEITRQMQQMIALKRVTMMDLRPILERSPAFGQVMLQKFGTISSEDIEKKFNDHTLSMKKFIETMTDGLNQVKDVPNNLANDWVNFQNEVKKTQLTVGQDLIPTFRELMKVGEDMTHAWASLNKEQREFWEKAVLMAAGGGIALKLGAGVISLATSVGALANAWRSVETAATAAATAEGLAAGAGAAGAAGAAAGPWGKAGRFVGTAVGGASGLLSAFGPAAAALAGEAVILGALQKGAEGAIDKSYANLTKVNRMIQWAKESAVRTGLRDPNDIARYVEEATGQTIGYRDLSTGKLNKPSYDLLAKQLPGLLKSSFVGPALPPGFKPEKAATDSGIVDKPVEAETVGMLTAKMVREMAKGIHTPAGVASCAFFASELVMKFADDVKREGGARNLRDQFTAQGIKPHGVDEAKAGDVGFVEGPQWGSKDAKVNGVGVHAFAYLENGQIIQSSGGKVSIKDAPKGAQFYSPHLKKGYDGQAGNGFDFVGNYLDRVAADKIDRETGAMAELAKANTETQRTYIKLKAGIIETGGELERLAMLANAWAKDEQNKAAADKAFIEGIANRTAKTVAEHVNAYQEARDKEIEAGKASLAELQIQQKVEREGLSHVEELQMKKAAGLVKYRSAEAEATALEIARQKDLDEGYKAMVARARGTGKLDELPFGLSSVAAKFFEAFKKHQEQMKAYADSLRDLSDRYEVATSKTGAYDVQLRHLAETYGDMEKAKVVMWQLLEVERAEAFRAEIEKLQQTMEDWVSNTIEGTLKDGFDGLWSSITRGFEDMLASMAREWIMFQLKTLYQNQLNGLLGGLFGGAGGGGNDFLKDGSIFGGGRASGGLVLDSKAYLVGEHGPELFYPGRTGTIVDHESSRAAMSARPVHVTVVVNATDAGSFVRSRDQIAREAGAAIERATRRTA